MAVATVGKAYRLASREAHPEDTVVRVGSGTVGSLAMAVMAGPCAVESREQALEAAFAVKAAARALGPRLGPED